jgi:autotransporter-associated beta strand protein
MNTRTPYCFVCVMAWSSGILVISAASSLLAANLYWNPGGTGGDEIWGTSPAEKNWNSVPGAPAGNLTWPDSVDDVAVFQDLIGGVVTLAGPLQANGIMQTGANYSINAGEISLMPNSVAANPFIHVQSGVLIIDSVIAGNHGLIKSGGGTLALTGSNTFTGNTLINNGIVLLAGSLASADIVISPGSGLINQNGGLFNNAMLTNEGLFTLNADDAITTYLSNGGTFTSGPGILSTTAAALNNGSILAGNLNTATLTSNGAVLLSGSATAGGVFIQSGTLSLGGTLASNSIHIAGGASLLVQNSGLSGTTTLTNAGALTLGSDDTVSSYISNGGVLAAGSGTLTSISSALRDGSFVAGRLKSIGITTAGTVQVGGTITAASINIINGTLTNSGSLGDSSTLLNINQGATLVANGSQRYSLLTTSGYGAATWRGDLRNTSIVAPGGLGGFGVLSVQGAFSQSAGGTLKLDLSETRQDLLDVSGKAIFRGSLVLNQSGADAMTPFVPVTVVSASGYAGNITSFTENLVGAAWFNPGNGTVTRIDLPNPGPSLFGGTRNQTSTWVALYDDVIDPEATNIKSSPGGYEITSGIADSGNPDLLWALASSFTPNGLNAALLNRLSPEVYGGMADYAMHATRAHQRSALSAPALAPMEKPKQARGGNEKSGAKDALVDASKAIDWEFFAALDYFSAGTDSSPNEADYDFDGAGVLTGARIRPRERTQVAAYFGADSGTMSGDLIDADAFGWNFGVTGEYLFDAKRRTRLRAAVSFGSYEFDGSRESVSATPAGWTPGDVGFDDLDVDAFDVFVGVDGVAWKHEVLTLTPSAGLRYATTTMDSFSETTTGAAGSPITLEVGRDRQESLLLELGLRLQAEVNSKLALWGESGVNIGLMGDGSVLGAAFSKGSRIMSARVRCLDDDSLYLGCGAVYQITGNVSAVVGYRADIRSEAEPQQELRLSSSWRF